MNSSKDLPTKGVPGSSPDNPMPISGHVGYIEDGMVKKAPFASLEEMASIQGQIDKHPNKELLITNDAYIAENGKLKAYLHRLEKPWIIGEGINERVIDVEIFGVSTGNETLLHKLLDDTRNQLSNISSK